MRLALIVGSAQPGRDGIGDHAAQLAGALLGRGHDAWLLALNDHHVDAERDDSRDEDGRGVAALRLPAAWPAARRYDRARQRLAQRQVDAVLFDMTPTHHDDRGLLWRHAPQLASLARGRRVAVLMHEYALGSETGAGPRRRLWGRLQRAGLRRFIAGLDRPLLAATNLLYARMMARDGWPAETVELYGNVPVLPAPADNWCHARLREAGIAGSGRRDFYGAGFFGSLYDGADLGAALPLLRSAARRADGRLAILSIGELGSSAALWQYWQRRFAGDIAFLALGRHAAAEISHYIAGLDLGLASVPMALAGKSGSLAAFADHGLATLMLNDSVHYRFLHDNRLCLPFNALPLDAQTAQQLDRQPAPPRRWRAKPALAAAADWAERTLSWPTAP